VRYWKVTFWTTFAVLLLTMAQYGSVHLLTGRPSSWLFEASLDLAPPLLFAGDVAQAMFNEGSQVPLRDQASALLVGLSVNLSLYISIALIATWLFFPPKRLTASTVYRKEA
jgi:hypothetical protein